MSARPTCPPPPPPRGRHRGSGVNARLAGAAALLLGAALLAPGVAWGQNVCEGTYSISTDSSLTCANQAWSQIRHAVSGSASLTITAPGGPATVISGTATTPSIGITASANTSSGDYAIRLGTTGAVRITGAGRGVEIDKLGGGGAATVDIGSAVTIGTMGAPMGEHGVYVRGGPGAVTVTNAGTIYATYEGVNVERNGGLGTLTVTHSGAITSMSSTHSPGMLVDSRGAGPMLVTTSGDVTATTSTQRGIYMVAQDDGAMTLEATGGAISASAQGVYVESKGDGAVTIRGAAAAGSGGRQTGGGPTIMAGTHGVHVHKSGSSATAGDVSIALAGGSITAGTGTGHHGVHVQDRAGYSGDVTIDSAADVTAGGRGVNVSRLGSGGVDVTIGAGASVTGGEVGVYVGGAETGLMVARRYTPGYGVGVAPGVDPGDPDEEVAATHGEGADAVALLDQLVTVRGTVTGGTGAAVHLAGGGGVLVLEGGSVRADSSGSGEAVLAVGGPALVYIDGEVRGGAGADAAVYLGGGGAVTIGLNGRVLANGAGSAIGGADGAAVTVTLVVPSLYRDDAAAAVARVEGGYLNVGDGVRLREQRNGVATGYSATLEFDEDGLLAAAVSGLDERPAPTFSLTCAAAGDGRCRMYEALPSMLLALNAPASRADRASAARDANGGWARVEASSGQWRAKSATAGALSYDHRWTVGRAGMDFAVRENLLAGVSVHAPRGAATVAGVGDVDLTGVGAGVSALWTAGEMWIDAGAAATRYEVDLTSHRHGRLLDEDAVGVGWALSVEAGRRLAAGERLRRFLGEAFVTPRAGFAWSNVSLRDFTDMETAGEARSRSRVSVADARSAKASVGATVETAATLGDASGRLFGSLDVERELSDETAVTVAGERTAERLETTARPTALSLGVGAAFDAGENALVTATAGWRASGGGDAAWSGSLQLRLQF